MTGIERVRTIPTYFGELRVSILPVGTERRIILAEVYKETVGKVREDAGHALVFEVEDLDPLIAALVEAKAKTAKNIVAHYP